MVASGKWIPSVLPLIEKQDIRKHELLHGDVELLEHDEHVV
jgi:hypothetical protein